MEKETKKVIKNIIKENPAKEIRPVVKRVEKLVETNSEVQIGGYVPVSINEALKKLRTFEKRKFNQTIDVIINLQKFDSRKESINSFISVPNTYERNIAAFLTTKVKGVEVILKDTFESYKNLRDAKRLAKRYDMFISAAPLMGQVATKFGRALGPSGKMPSPQLGIVLKEDEETIKKLVDKMKKSVKVRTKEKVVKIGIGKEDMSDDKLKENIESAVKGVIELLPLKKDNVKNVLIKFTMTPPVKIEYGN